MGKNRISIVLAIDPGAKAGWALSHDAVIVSAGLVRLDKGERIRTFAEVDVLICEKPQFYPGDSAKQANDLIILAIRAGELCAQACPCVVPTWVRPHEWKGSVPKDIHNARVLSRMSLEERALLVDIPSSVVNNVVDAIGINMYQTGRYRT